MRTPFDWEQPATVPAGPLADDEPDQELDIDWQAYMMEEPVESEPRCGGSRHVPGAGRWEKSWGLAVPGGPETCTADTDTGCVLGILDSACSRTCHGSEWGDAYRSFLTNAGLAWEELQTDVAVRGIGGRVQCTRAVKWPVGLYGRPGEILSLEIPNQHAASAQPPDTEDTWLRLRLRRGVG